jgi:hypothetical protein
MPKPTKGESKDHFISRCVKEVMGEGKEQQAALGQCFGTWRSAHGDTAKSFFEAFTSPFVTRAMFEKMRGPPRLAEAIGTRAMDEEGLPVTFPHNAIARPDDDDEDKLPEGPDDEDAEELAEEAAEDVELRAKTFADVIKQQPSVSGVHVPSASGRRRRRRNRLTVEESKQLEDQQLEADLSTMGQDTIPGERRRLTRPTSTAVQGAPDTEKAWSLPLAILKADPDRRLIFGWASVAESDGQVIVDKQGDIIPPEALEEAAYEYVLSSRDGGDMHERRGVSKLVASVVLTSDIKRAMGITSMVPDNVGWFVGFKVHDDELWSAVKRGERPEFSIGGASLAAEVENIETYLAHRDVFTKAKGRGRRHARPPFRW